MDLSNLFEALVHYRVIRGIVGFCYQDRVPMVSALMCMVTHWIRPIVSHDIRLWSSHDFTKLLHSIISQPWENIELVQKLAMAFSYGWDPKVIIYFLWIESLLMEVNRISIFNRVTMISHRLWDSGSPWVILRTYDHEIYGPKVIPLVKFEICS